MDRDRFGDAANDGEPQEQQPLWFPRSGSPFDPSRVGMDPGSQWRPWPFGRKAAEQTAVVEAHLPVDPDVTAPADAENSAEVEVQTPVEAVDGIEEPVDGIEEPVDGIEEPVDGVEEPIAVPMDADTWLAVAGDVGNDQESAAELEEVEQMPEFDEPDDVDEEAAAVVSAIEADLTADETLIDEDIDEDIDVDPAPQSEHELEAVSEIDADVVGEIEADVAHESEVDVVDEIELEPVADLQLDADVEVEVEVEVEVDVDVEVEVEDDLEAELEAELEDEPELPEPVVLHAVTDSNDDDPDDLMLVEEVVPELELVEPLPDASPQPTNGFVTNHGSNLALDLAPQADLDAEADLDEEVDEEQESEFDEDLVAQVEDQVESEDLDESQLLDERETLHVADESDAVDAESDDVAVATEEFAHEADLEADAEVDEEVDEEDNVSVADDEAEFDPSDEDEDAFDDEDEDEPLMVSSLSVVPVFSTPQPAAEPAPGWAEQIGVTEDEPDYVGSPGLHLVSDAEAAGQDELVDERDLAEDSEPVENGDPVDDQAAAEVGELEETIEADDEIDEVNDEFAVAEELRSAQLIVLGAPTSDIADELDADAELEAATELEVDAATELEADAALEAEPEPEDGLDELMEETAALAPIEEAKPGLPSMDDLMTMVADLNDVDAILERLDTDEDALFADMAAGSATEQALEFSAE